MNKMQHYFDAQMRLLGEAGKQFASHYPEHARFLNIDLLTDRDPHIERLLEGVAYLTAHLQQRLEQSQSEVAEQLLRQLCPFLLTPYPSTTVLQFSPLMNMLSSQIVEKGLEVSAAPVAETNVRCRFRLCQPLTVVPLNLSQVRCEETPQGSELRIGFRWSSQGKSSSADLSLLSLYLCGDTPLTSSLFQMLTTAQSIDIEAIDIECCGSAPILLGSLSPGACSPLYFNGSEALLPDASASASHPGYALLHDYFCARDRNLFVGVSGLDKFVFPSSCDGFELVFRSEITLPPGHQLSLSNILLNCVPAVNLFEQYAEPIRLQEHCNEYQLIPEQHQRDAVFTYSVEHIAGIEKGTGASCDYLPRYQGEMHRDKRQYTLHLKEIGTGSAMHYINIPLAATALDDTLSVDLAAFNGMLPRQYLREGDINQGGRTMSTTVSVRNITRPSGCIMPPDSDYQWLLIGMLNIQLSSLLDAEHLKKLLTLLDWSEKSENRQRIASLLAIETTRVKQICRGVFINGIELQLSLDERRFACRADIYHFSCVLHHFFVMSAPMTECVQTRVQCQPSFDEWLWPFQQGRSAAL